MRKLGGGVPQPPRNRAYAPRFRSPLARSVYELFVRREGPAVKRWCRSGGYLIEYRLGDLAQYFGVDVADLESVISDSSRFEIDMERRTPQGERIGPGHPDWQLPDFEHPEAFWVSRVW
jgi:hypothetical protein